MRKRKQSSNESGAALIAVIFISILLMTACAMLLTAVGHNSRNSTDVLSETKAYYAAESGIQAAINVFRNDTTLTNPYSYAVNDSRLATKLPYVPISGEFRVPIGSTSSSYTISIDDPDNSKVSTTYSVDGEFLQADGFSYASTRSFGSTNITTLSFVPVASTTVNQPMANGTTFGSFRVTNTGAGSAITPTKFRINYRMSAPRAAVRSMRGTIQADGTIAFDAYTYSLMGPNNLKLCSTVSCSTAGTAFTLSAPIAGGDSAQFYGKMDAIEPYRLRIIAIGYGPNGSKKELRAVVQRNFFNDLGSSAAIAMVGPNAYFSVGTSAQMQISGGGNPSVTVSDQAGLNTVNSQHTNGTITPPPEIAGPDVPDWQQNTQAMDAFIKQLKQAAQNSGRYYDSSTAPPSFGDFNSGQGITFCDRSCTMGGNTEGGGILVVTHTLYTSGNPKFNGLVLVVGQYLSSGDPGGMVRSGGGNEIFTGNIVIAPYNPDNLAAGWGQPRYDQSGGPGDTVNSAVAVDQAFDGTSAITDFILGIVEK
jgi:Tfp pilus assembly protein PilX